MDIDHDTLVGFAKSWGLFYLIAFASALSSTRSGPRTGNGSTTPSGTFSMRTTGHGSRGTRSRQRSDRRPGHEWNGIKELDTPVPRGVLIFIIVTHVWALLWWILMPTWPLVTTYTKGILGTDQRKIVEQDLGRSPGRASGLDEGHRNVELRGDPGQRGPDEGRPDDRPPALRRQLRRLPRGRREGPRQLSRPDGRRLALGRRAWRRSPRPCGWASTPAIRTPGSRRCRPSGATRCWTATQVTNVATYVQSLSNPAVSTPQNVAQDPGRAGGLPHDLRGLPRRGRQGQPGGRCAQPDRSVLGLRRRPPDPHHHDPWRAAGAHADLGRAPDPGGDQDPVPCMSTPWESRSHDGR